MTPFSRSVGSRLRDARRILPQTGDMTVGEASGAWLSRGEAAAARDDAGAVLRAWRIRNRQTQTTVAELLNTTQQHLSQIEKGTRPLSLEQRRMIVAELGIPALAEQAPIRACPACRWPVPDRAACSAYTLDLVSGLDASSTNRAPDNRA